MDCERRGFLAAAALFCLVGCAPPVRRDGASGLTAGGWARFKAQFIQSDGRVVDTGNNNISHTEGQGYALLLAATLNDRATFDRVLAWTERTLARPDIALFSWRYTPGQSQPINDLNNATDGDMLIAWALTRAAERWDDPAYAERSGAIRQAIRTRLVSDRFGNALLLPGLTGFEQPDRLTLNPSYYVWPALDAFAAADGHGTWEPVIRDGLTLLRLAKFGQYRLPADWIDVHAATNIVPAQGRPPRFGYDAVRVPLYLLLSGRRNAAADVASFWRSLAAAHRPPPAWVDVITGAFAPYPLSSGGLAIVDRLVGRAKTESLASDMDYYSSILGLMAQLDQK